MNNVVVTGEQLLKASALALRGDAAVVVIRQDITTATRDDGQVPDVGVEWIDGKDRVEDKITNGGHVYREKRSPKNETR